MAVKAQTMFKLWLDGHSQPSLTHFPKDPVPGELITKDGRTFRVIRVEDTTNVDGHVHVYARPE